jgi:hypothetical protein
VDGLVKVAIMQPTYLPWAGFLRLIGRVDQFVYLDDAQYERGTWHQRNRLLLDGNALWLTVPVLRRHLGQAINQVLVDDAAQWRRKHVATIQASYSRHPFAADALALADMLTQRDELTTLADLNIALIEKCCSELGLEAGRARASELGVPGNRTQRVIAICESLRATTYISPPGARDYLAQDGFERLTGIQLEFDEFDASPYPQRGARYGFVSHLSVVDAVANLGWAGLRQYIGIA